MRDIAEIERELAQAKAAVDDAYWRFTRQRRAGPVPARLTRRQAELETELARARFSANARYIYLGDVWSDPALRGQPCTPVLRPDGKCIVGASKQLVRFADGVMHVVLRRRLRVRR